MTPHEFHRMTDLRCNGPIIGLVGVSGPALSIELLGHQYTTELVHYFDLEVNFRYLP